MVENKKKKKNAFVWKIAKTHLARLNVKEIDQSNWISFDIKNIDLIEWFESLRSICSIDKMYEKPIWLKDEEEMKLIEYEWNKW